MCLENYFKVFNMYPINKQQKNIFKGISYVHNSKLYILPKVTLKKAFIAFTET